MEFCVIMRGSCFIFRFDSVTGSYEVCSICAGTQKNLGWYFLFSLYFDITIALNQNRSVIVQRSRACISPASFVSQEIAWQSKGGTYYEHAGNQRNQ